VTREQYGACTVSSDEQSCTDNGGVWTYWSGVDEWECECETGDEGCPCTTSNDCVGYCIADSYQDCSGITVGECIPPGGGCFCYFFEEGSDPEPACVN
jgi:hypothetical protein